MFYLFCARSTSEKEIELLQKKLNFYKKVELLQKKLNARTRRIFVRITSENSFDKSLFINYNLYKERREKMIDHYSLILGIYIGMGIILVGCGLITFIWYIKEK